MSDRSALYEDIYCPLERMHRRHMMRLSIHCLLWGSSAVVLTWALSRILLERTAQVSELTAPALTALLVVFAGVLLVRWRTPNLNGVAREADMRLGLAEQLSSSLQVIAHWPQRSGPVSRALIRQARISSARLHPPSLVPILVRAHLIAAGALAAAIILLFLTFQPVDGGREMKLDAPDAGPGLSVEVVKEMAGLVAADARLRDSDLLNSVAMELERVIRDAGQGMSQQEMDNRLSELIEQMRMGYGATPPGWLPAAREPLSTLGERLEAHRRAMQAREQNEGPLPNPGLGGARESEGPNEAHGADPTTLGTPAGSMEASGNSAGAVAASPSSSSNPDPRSASDMRAGMPVGASRQSGSGEGDMAGLGNQPVGGNQHADLSAPEGGAEVAITAANPVEGNRIRVHVPPPEPGANTGNAHGDHRLPAGTRLSGDVISRERIGTTDRSVVARYFSPAATPMDREP